MVRVKDGIRRLKSTYNPNTQLDSREFEAMFDDKTINEYSANVIVENLHSIVDDGVSSNHFFS